MPPPNTVDSASGGMETVLLVEDEPSVRKMISFVLCREGYTVMEASDGVEALKLSREHASQEIHLLLTDVGLPNMDGITLSGKFGALRPGARVLLMSGYVHDIPADSAGLPNVIGFLPKPFTPGILATTVRKALDT